MGRAGDHWVRDLLLRGPDERFVAILASAPIILGVLFTQRGILPLIGAGVAVLCVTLFCTGRGLRRRRPRRAARTGTQVHLHRASMRVVEVVDDITDAE
jgi:hypothetical protein